MIEPIDDMPAGTIGFRSAGELSEEDFRDVLAPALASAVATGPVRLLLVTPTNFGPADVKPMADRVRDHLDDEVGHRTDWKRIAIVTDSGLLRRSSRLWSHLVPVETKLFKSEEEPQARAWLLAS